MIELKRKRYVAPKCYLLVIIGVRNDNIESTNVCKEGRLSYSIINIYFLENDK